MIKETRGKDVYYKLAWSDFYAYDKYTAMRILPELAGIVCLGYIENKMVEYLLFYACWRDGCRVGLKKFMDPDYSKLIDIQKQIDPYRLHYKYTVVDTNLKDLKDIMFWLIREYKPLFNDASAFSDSKRYKNIFMKETMLNDEDVVERIPGSRRR